MAQKKSFEVALKELEQIVQQLERADIPLEDALKQFQKGVELSQYCKQTLDNAEKMVTTLMMESGQEEILS